MGKVREKPPRASSGEEGRSHLEGCQGSFFPKGLPLRTAVSPELPSRPGGGRG